MSLDESKKHGVPRRGGLNSLGTLKPSTLTLSREQREDWPLFKGRRDRISAMKTRATCAGS